MSTTERDSGAGAYSKTLVEPVEVIVISCPQSRVK